MQSDPEPVGVIATIAEQPLCLRQIVQQGECSEAGISVVVEPSGRLVGLATKTDVVRQMSVCNRISCRDGILTVITSEVTSCTATDRLHDVSARMRAANLKNIIVIDEDGRPVAVLTAPAILRVLLQDAEYEETQLVNYVRSVGYRCSGSDRSNN